MCVFVTMYQQTMKRDQTKRPYQSTKAANDHIQSNSGSNWLVIDIFFLFLFFGKIIFNIVSTHSVQRCTCLQINVRLSVFDLLPKYRKKKNTERIEFLTCKWMDPLLFLFSSLTTQHIQVHCHVDVHVKTTKFYDHVISIINHTS